MSKLLKASRINKSIRNHKILTDISFELESGHVYGLWGRNGSGKTMLFRALSGLMKVDSGSICWDGQKLHQDFSVLPNLGIVLEHAGLYPNMTGMENLSYLAGIKKTANRQMICEAMERVGLDPYDKRIYRKYSMGMKQRLAIAQAVMEQPDIIMLDEPANGLDESGVWKIRTLIRQEKERGALILLASHNREDMTLLADHINHMSDGSLAGGAGV